MKKKLEMAADLAHDVGELACAATVSIKVKPGQPKPPSRKEVHAFLEGVASCSSALLVAIEDDIAAGKEPDVVRTFESALMAWLDMKAEEAMDD